VDSGEVIYLNSIDSADGYGFNMDGQTERTFRVILSGD
jgi:hypothetical protein